MQFGTGGTITKVKSQPLGLISGDKFGQHLWDVTIPPASNALRFIQEVFAISERFRGVLITGHRDGLDVLIAPAFTGWLTGGLQPAPDEGRRIGIILEVLHRFRPPSTLPLGLGCSAFRRSRSMQRLSILSNIRCNITTMPPARLH